jgi:hypothetical protein
VVEDKPGFEGGVYYETRHKSETPPVFSDPALGLFLAPIVSNRELFINITYHTQDGVQAKAWVENMRSRVIATRLRIPHRVSAYYIVPDEIIEIIEHVYELRENKAGYGESLQDYFVARADNRFTTFTDQGEKNKALGFSVPYAELYGWFENPNEPDKPERSDKGENYTATLTYRVQLDVHTSMLLRYPIIVHNQYIDRKHLYEIKPTFYDKLNVDGTQTAILDGYYGAKRPALDPEFSYGIRLPKHDDWLAQPLTYAPHTLQLYLVLIVIDEKNPSLFMNIQDVQELKLPDFVWDYIRSETNWMLTAANSLFQFSLFLQDEPKKETTQTNSNDFKQNQTPSNSTKKKLSFKEQRELETIEKEMPELEKKRAEILEKLNNESDYEKIATLSAELEKVSEKLEEYEMRWLELQEILN